MKQESPTSKSGGGSITKEGEIDGCILAYSADNRYPAFYRDCIDRNRKQGYTINSTAYSRRIEPHRCTD
ncbi:MAG TPA: hypothetical protein GX712_07065 [Bacteroidales bacterium]|nr:hypothetical protein [Bacteroidales bacterium]